MENIVIISITQKLREKDIALVKIRYRKYNSGSNILL